MLRHECGQQCGGLGRLLAAGGRGKPNLTSFMRPTSAAPSHWPVSTIHTVGRKAGPGKQLRYIMVFVAARFNLVNYCSELQKRKSHPTGVGDGELCMCSHQPVALFGGSLLPLVSSALPLICSSRSLILSQSPPPQTISPHQVFFLHSHSSKSRGLFFFFFLAALLTMINRCWWSLPYTTSLVKFRAALRLANLRRGWARTRSVGCRRGQVLGRKGAPIFGRLSGSAGFGAAAGTKAVGSVRGTSQRALRGPGGCREHASLR